MLTSRAYGGLAKLLEALRAHYARIVEQLAQQQAQSRSNGVQTREKDKEKGAGGGGTSASAKALLKFSTPRDPAALAAFINLRVLNPEHEHWRRGIEAAVIYAREHGNLKVPLTYRVPERQEAEAEGWPAPLAAFPLGQWIADARRFYARGDMMRTASRSWKSSAWCGRTSMSRGKRAWLPFEGGPRNTGTLSPRSMPRTRGPRSGSF
jgi:hypothetical protein